jgi:hypothetical protein
MKHNGGDRPLGQLLLPIFHENVDLAVDSRRYRLKLRQYNTENGLKFLRHGKDLPWERSLSAQKISAAAAACPAKSAGAGVAARAAASAGGWWPK